MFIDIGTLRPVIGTSVIAKVPISLRLPLSSRPPIEMNILRHLIEVYMNMTQLEYDRLAFGNYALSRLPKLSPWQFARALLAYCKANHLYQKQGYAPTLTYLEELNSSANNHLRLSSIDALRLARTNTLLFALVGKVVRQPNNCLAMALPYTAALISIGIEAKTVIGKTTFATHDSYLFHAWIEVSGLPVFEDESVHSHYWVIDIIPD